MKKVCSRRALVRFLGRFRRAGKKVVFTNGCFDLLHAGHVTYLEKARKFGDLLVLGLNSDASVRRLKGPGRPVNSETDRLRVMAALEAVDFVTLFSETTPLRLICEIRPDVLAKGADWRESEIVGAREVKSWGGRVKRIRLLPGRSTTRMLEILRGRDAERQRGRDKMQ